MFIDALCIIRGRDRNIPLIEALSPKSAWLPHQRTCKWRNEAPLQPGLLWSAKNTATIPWPRLWELCGTNTSSRVRTMTENTNVHSDDRYLLKSYLTGKELLVLIIFIHFNFAIS